MGKQFAEDLKDGIVEFALGMSESIRIHLAYNHYPPVPAIMVEPCIEAINAFNEGDYQKQIELPEGVSWRGSHTAPASAIVEAHHLDTWCHNDEEQLWA